MSLTARMKRPPPNICPQGTLLDDLIGNVMPPMISRLTHVDPRAQVNSTSEVSPQEGQLFWVATRLGRRGHDPATDTAPTLLSAEVYDEA